MGNSRMDFVCPEDCSNCKLLMEGQVNQVSCCLDQLMQRMRLQREEIKELNKSIQELKISSRNNSFASVEESNESSNKSFILEED